MSEEWTMRDCQSFDWKTADFSLLEETAEAFGCYYVWKTLYRAHDNGLDYLLILAYEPNSEYFESMPIGWYRDPEAAVSDAINLLETYGMNLHENHKLFPNIRGVMLKDRAMKLTLSKQVQITEMQGGDARVELSFTDHKKTAVINRNQAQNIINMYGPETDDWQGEEVILYGEHGKWFGKNQWGIRVWDTTNPDKPPDTVQAAMKAKAGQDRKPAKTKPAKTEKPFEIENWYAFVAKKLPHFKNTPHIKNTVEVLGQSLPTTKEEGWLLLDLLTLYALHRDDGLETAEAAAATLAGQRPLFED